MVNLLIKVYAEFEYYPLVFPPTLLLEKSMVAIVVYIIDPLLALLLVVDIVGAEIRVVDLLLILPLTVSMVAIEIYVVDLSLALLLVVSIVAIEIRIVDLLLVFSLAVGILGAEVCMMLFPLLILLWLGIVALVKSLVGARIMTEPDLAIMALFVEDASKFL